MSKRVFAGGVVRLVAGALALSLVLAPAAFAKGNDNGKGGDHGKDDRSIPNCSRGGHEDDGDDRGGGGGEDHLFCPNKQVLVRIDEKTCPDKPGRPAVVQKRVCCRHGDMTNCHPFHPCPPRSRS
jgi:hypothetical protein